MAADTRDRILDALETLLLDDGADKATLEAVASRAGVSKGGLLYHFPSKDAMMAAIEQTPESGRRHIRAMRRQVLAHDVDRWARSFLAALGRTGDEEPNQMISNRDIGQATM